MVNSDVIKREGSCEVFYIRQHLTCKSTNVVYVVRCKRCDRLGVGECLLPKKRLMDYVRAAGKMTLTTTSAVEKHFLDCPLHDERDLEFTLVDALPLGCKPACWDSERSRLEEIWIAKLHPSLNIKKQVRNSFTGFARARLPPAIDDLIATLSQSQG